MAKFKFISTADVIYLNDGKIPLREATTAGNYSARNHTIKFTSNLLILSSFLVVGACSVTDYEQPISQFSAATENSETALIGLDKQLTDAYAALHVRRVLNRELQPQFARSDDGIDCQVSSERCRLVVVGRDRTVEGKLPPDPALRKMIVLMASIRRYAQNLTEIVKADTAAKVTANVNATVGSVESLAATVQKLGGSKQPVDLKEYATPVGEAINWFVGNYVAVVKLDGLSRATQDAKPVVADASLVFGVAAREASFAPRRSLAETVSLRNDAFAENRTQANLDQLIASVVTYDQFLLSKPEDVFVRMQTAHDALVDNIQSKEPSLAEVSENIEAFATEAQSLVRIIGSLAALGKEKGEK